ncbi:hypothetical protein E0Z10_g3796 [Xylaria hypoxylon]|uniref:Uncharacterized protein n=1 Tax=Xylaria hypoxylon TaxID=37992 RepID=A0A4Z0YYC1_9PEZI|nr:hypothetical protein E0Z10_g3796 [Xylaria hypoxylon]
MRTEQEVPTGITLEIITDYTSPVPLTNIQDLFRNADNITARVPGHEQGGGADNIMGNETDGGIESDGEVAYSTNSDPSTRVLDDGQDDDADDFTGSEMYYGTDRDMDANTGDGAVHGSDDSSDDGAGDGSEDGSEDDTTRMMSCSQEDISPPVFSVESGCIVYHPLLRALVNEATIDVNGDPNGRDSKRGTTMLMRAALLSIKADIEAVDNNGWRALHHAIKPNNRTSFKRYRCCHIQALLDNAPSNLDLSARTNEGHTAISLLVGPRVGSQIYPDDWRDSRAWATELLLCHGASARETVTQGEYAGGTLLHLACFGGEGNVVDMLLRNGADADVNAITHNGETPLMAAVAAKIQNKRNWFEFEAMVVPLVHYGADITIKNARGQTVWEALCLATHRVVESCSYFNDLKLILKPNDGEANS